MPRPYIQGDRHRASRDFVRVHRPTCVEQRGECGCSKELVPQPYHFFINDEEVTEQEYGEAQADYRRLLALGRAP